MALKHFLKRQNRSKNKIRKITVKCRNDVKVPVFDMFFCYISAIFEYIDLKLCTHIYETSPFDISYGFLKILIWGNCFEREKNVQFFWKNFEIFKILKIRNSSFIALLILRQFV